MENIETKYNEDGTTIVKYPNGDIFHYDNFQRIVVKEFVSGNCFKVRYDKGGNLVYQKDADGDQRYWIYNHKGKAIWKKYIATSGNIYYKFI